MCAKEIDCIKISPCLSDEEHSKWGQQAGTYQLGWRKKLFRGAETLEKIAQRSCVYKIFKIRLDQALSNLI